MFRKSLRSIMSITLAMLLVFSSMSFMFAEHYDNKTKGKKKNVVYVCFKDIPEGHWAAEAIKDMYKQGIINGKPDGTFAPANPVTREEFAKLLVMTFGLELVYPPVPTFRDVDRNSWSYPYVEAAKEYMTGYFPPNGKPFFDPGSNATREDIAVALVRAMGKNGEKVDTDILDDNFRDADSVSPQLIREVAIAVKLKLIKGFEDDTIRADAAIDRASAASLLYRVLKSPYKPSPSNDVKLNVEVPSHVTSDRVTVKGSTNSNARIFINDYEYAVNNGCFEQMITLGRGEGNYEIVIKALLPDGQSKVVKKNVSYSNDAPKISCDVPATSPKQTLSISGKVENPSVVQYITVNGNWVNWNQKGKWAININLSEGSNEIAIFAKGKNGKDTTIKKYVYYKTSTPIINLNTLPAQTNSSKIIVSGWVSDAIDSNPKMYINNTQVSVSSNNHMFSKEISLKAGENIVEFKAVNNQGRQTIIRKSIYLQAEAANVEFSTIPETTYNQKVTIAGKVVDNTGSSPKLYINGSYINLSGRSNTFSRELTLKSGDNAIEFRTISSLGIEKKFTKHITLTLEAATVTFSYMPDRVNTDKIVVTGKLSDVNGNSPKLYINGQWVDLFGSEHSFSKELSLKEGDNTIDFKTVSTLGREYTFTKHVTLVSEAASIIFTSIPETTSKNKVTVAGKVVDNSGNSPTLLINGVQTALSGSEHNFSKEITLDQGENNIEFKVISSVGKTTTVNKRINFTANAPQLTVNAPSTSSSVKLTIKGTIQDEIYDHTQLNVKVNGKAAPINGENQWSLEIQLMEGDNTITVVGQNAAGKSTLVQKTIVLEIPKPELTVNAPETSASDKIEIIGTVVDQNDDNVVVKVNNQQVEVDSKGVWKTTVTLAQGPNKITVTAANKFGKVISIERTINYQKSR